MSVTNPFDHINDKLDQIQKSLIAWFSKQEDQAKHQQQRTYSEDFLTLYEVAAMLKKPIGTIRRYVHYRGLPARRLGKPYLVKRQDLIQWLEKWLADENMSTISSTDGYSKMLEHRKRYAK